MSAIFHERKFASRNAGVPRIVISNIKREFPLLNVRVREYEQKKRARSLIKPEYSEEPRSHCPTARERLSRATARVFENGEPKRRRENCFARAATEAGLSHSKRNLARLGTSARLDEIRTRHGVQGYPLRQHSATLRAATAITARGGGGGGGGGLLCKGRRRSTTYTWHRIGG